MGLMVEMVKDEPLYQPNEPHLQTEGLQEALRKMNCLNTKVVNTQVAWSNARLELNNQLYEGDSSLYATASSVKKYVRAIFGLNSPQYKQLKSLQFSKPTA